jgi:hypothetical protein
MKRIRTAATYFDGIFKQFLRHSFALNEILILMPLTDAVRIPYNNVKK